MVSHTIPFWVHLHLPPPSLLCNYWACIIVVNVRNVLISLWHCQRKGKGALTHPPFRCTGRNLLALQVYSWQWAIACNVFHSVLRSHGTASEKEAKFTKMFSSKEKGVQYGVYKNFKFSWKMCQHYWVFQSGGLNIQCLEKKHLTLFQKRNCFTRTQERQFSFIDNNQH